MLLCVLPFMIAGGGERHFVTLARGLTERGHRVRAFVLQHDDAHFSSHFAPYLIEPPLEGRYPDVALRIAEYIDAERPQALLFHGSDIGAYAVLAARHKPQQVVAVKHTLWDADAEMLTMPHVQQAVTTYVCVSNSAASHLRRFADVSPIVIRNGVDTSGLSDAHPVRRELGLPANAFVVCHIGRMCDDKGSLLLATALKRIPDCWGLFVGWGEQTGPIQDIAGSQIKVLAPTTDVWRFYLSSDMMVLPTKAEGAIPYAVTEAALAGCLIATTPVGDLEEVFTHGVNYLRTSRNVKALVNTIRSGMKMPDRAQVAAAGRNLVASFASAEKMVDAYETVLGLGEA